MTTPPENFINGLKTVTSVYLVIIAIQDFHTRLSVQDFILDNVLITQLLVLYRKHELRNTFKLWNLLSCD